MAWKDKDEMLDDLWDHCFPEDGEDPTDEDEKWFGHLSSFFDVLDEKPSGEGGSGGPKPPRRRRVDTTKTRRRPRTASGSGGHGYSQAFFGQ